jgi:nucleoside-diphosphate-sugar epimerase
VGDRVAVIFGGAGFIGTHLTKGLIASGEYDQIIVCDRHPPMRNIEGVDYRICDVTLPIDLERIPAQCEIYNLAAVHTTPGHEDWEYYWTNVWGAIHVCDFAKRSDARLIYFSSSISVYGPTETPRDESGPFLPESAYGRSKLMAESIHRMWRLEATGRVVRIVRPAVIFGAGENGNFTRLAQSLKRGVFVFPGRDDAIKACGYVGELVRAMMFVRDLPEPEIIYNFAYPARYTTKEIAAALCREAGYRIPHMIVPQALMMLGGVAFEVLAALGLKTSLNRARLRKLIDSTNIVPTRLLELGYKFDTDLRQGLAQWRKQSPSGDFV